MTKTDILGIKIDSLTQNQVLEKIDVFLREVNNPQIGKQIITANPEIILSDVKNDQYKTIINNSSLVIADGIGLLWAAKFLSLKSDDLIIACIQAFYCLMSLIFLPEYCKEVLPERITGVDLMEKICEQAANKGWKVFLLGAEEGIAEKTAEVLKTKYNNINIVGAEQGIRRYELEITYNELHAKLIERINLARPDILFVAFGAPKQEFFIHEHLPKLPSVKLAMGVGGAFDFIAGKITRAPIIFQDLGIEWLWRFISQPWRIARIFKATVIFAIKVVIFKNNIKHESKN